MTIRRVDNQSKTKERSNNDDDSTTDCKYPSNEGDVGDSIKQFHGDGLFVRLHTNHRMLVITGDGCQIVLTKNSGSVHIIGDGCKLRVNHNVGDIEYIGDGGRILLGPDSSKGKVKFVGDGGKVILDSCPKAVLKRSSTEQRNVTNNCAVKATSCCEKIIGNKTSISERCENNGGTSNRENLDDTARCPSDREKYDRRDGRIRKSLRHPTVTTIITKIQSDGQCVTKRFGDSSLIVDIRGDGCPTTKNYVGSFEREHRDQMT